MPQFSYRAKSKDGEKVISGNVEALSKAQAIELLAEKGIRPIIVEPVKTGGFDPNDIHIPFLDKLKKVKLKDLVIFTRQLSTLVSAGVPLVRSISTLQSQTESKLLKSQLSQVITDVSGGESLADALAKFPETFSAIYVNMVRAGETGGILEDVLDRLALQQEKDALIKSKIKAAMAYPVVIGFVAIIAFFLLMTVIVPKIGAILKEMGGQLPIYTRILLSVSDILKQPPVIIGLIVFVIVSVVVFKRFTATSKGRYKWHYLLLHTPTIGGLLSKIAISRFARTFASLLSAGVPIVETISTTAGAVGSAVIEKELRDAAKEIQAGKQFSTQLEKSQYFPPMVSQMVAIGEETGQTETIILKVSEFYDSEVDTVIGSISSIIEPVMILLLGGMVGLIAISVFGPIAQISTSVH